jgi:hypothetical protein
MKTKAKITFYTDDNVTSFCVMWEREGYLSESFDFSRDVCKIQVSGFFVSRASGRIGDGKRHDWRVNYVPTLANHALATQDEIVKAFRAVFPDVAVRGCWV